MSGFRFAHGEAVRIAKTGDLATVISRTATPYENFYEVRRAGDGVQIDVSENALRSSSAYSNVIPFPSAHNGAVQ